MMRRRLRRAWEWVKDQVEGGRPVHYREFLARTYLCGEGLEIGALSSPLAVPGRVKVRYVDRMSTDELRRHYPDLAAEPLVPVEVIDDGEQLATVPDGSQQFVIANHFLEHCQDPIRAASNFFRVLRPGGVLYMAVPDKRFTFDRERAVTPLEHLLDDHRDGPERSREEHFLDYARFVIGSPSEAGVRELANHLKERDHSIHFHVWTQKEMLEMLLWLRETIGFDIEVAAKNGPEVIFILRKHTALSAAA